MQSALTVSRAIDGFLWVMAKIGAWCALLLVLVVTYDVTTRYLGVPKVFGLTSTMLQESEYWLHSFLIVLVVGYAYTKQSHVRIDLIRENLSDRAKYMIEVAGILLALIPYSFLGAWLSWPYVVRSFTSGKISNRFDRPVDPEKWVDHPVRPNRTGRDIPTHQVNRRTGRKAS